VAVPKLVVVALLTVAVVDAVVEGVEAGKEVEVVVIEGVQTPQETERKAKM